MECPRCKSVQLAPTRLEPTLAAHGCKRCHGTLLGLPAYRLWRERHGPQSAAPATVSASEVADSRQALVCTRCRRIMLKFRYLADDAHGLDLCQHCEDVWLDHGEWELLKARHLEGDLPAIFTGPWQQRLRAARTRERRALEWERRLGPETHARVREFGEWLRAHPERAAILDFLGSRDPYGKG